MERENIVVLSFIVDSQSKVPWVSISKTATSSPLEVVIKNTSFQSRMPVVSRVLPGLHWKPLSGVSVSSIQLGRPLLLRYRSKKLRRKDLPCRYAPATDITTTGRSFTWSAKRMRSSSVSLNSMLWPSLTRKIFTGSPPIATIPVRDPVRLHAISPGDVRRSQEVGCCSGYGRRRP
uniref:Uncharacterized protein n=1 Tax=Rhipicephalus zambeziensis TaxID=60191 RepID=A0A224YFQ6_9ACAR